MDLTALARSHEIPAGMLVAKAECMQHTGSFKYRGASNRLSMLTPRELDAGVVTYSSGNHAAALSTVAKRLGTTVVTIVPNDTSATKLAKIRAAGARLVHHDPSAEDRTAIARKIAESEGRILVPPYDDYRVMAGQGTLALELVEQAGRLDVVVVPIGGGGLIAGVATAVRGIAPGARVVGVEPSGADDTRRSLAAGRRVCNVSADTIADGLRTRTPGELTFPIVTALVSEVVSVADAAIAASMAALSRLTSVRVEPSGAVALAAVLTGQVPINRQERVGVVLSGGNVDASRFERLTRDH